MEVEETNELINTVIEMMSKELREPIAMLFHIAMSNNEIEKHE